MDWVLPKCLEPFVSSCLPSSHTPNFHPKTGVETPAAPCHSLATAPPILLPFQRGSGEGGAPPRHPHPRMPCGLPCEAGRSHHLPHPPHILHHRWVTTPMISKGIKHQLFVIASHFSASARPSFPSRDLSPAHTHPLLSTARPGTPVR